jgi:tyrosine-specific transport protein
MFLVGGTCIGGGMLALPITTGLSGFLPSLAVMFFCWLAMTATALLLLEASLWMEEGVHVITMTSRLLGVSGKVVSWILYLFISYASIVAYSAGGGIQIADAISRLYDVAFTRDHGCFLFLVLFGAVVYLGNTAVGRVNAVLFVAMIVAYVVLVGMGTGEVNPSLLSYRQWSNSLLAIPLMLTSFSFQTMVPSLTPYLKSHVRSLRLAIIGGTFLAFVIYAIWLALILGIVPVGGTNGLSAALAQGEPATQFLRAHVEGRYVAQIAEFFAFFAIVTSFLGMALGLFDFLADGLHIPKMGWGNVLLGLLIVVPTLIFAVKFERIFLLALDTSGGFGDTILNGIIPVLMVWMGRYRLGYKGAEQVPGGKVALTLILLFFVVCLGMKILSDVGYLPSVHDVYEDLELTVPELKHQSL